MNTQAECDGDNSDTRLGVLGWLDANIEKPFLVLGMLSIIFIITFQTLYRYIGVYLHEGASTKPSWTNPGGWYCDTTFIHH